LIRKALSAGALAAALSLVFSIPGLASATQISGTSSPLAACPNGSQTGKNFVDGETEPSLAVYKSQMIAMWHQDRWNNGGAHGIGVGYSSNAGVNWGQTTFPDDMCTTTAPDPLAAYQRSSDPWVAFSSDGKTAYASALSFDNTDNHNAVAAGYSRDGGQTWKVSTIPGSEFNTFQFSTDKNSTTADPNDPGVAYTVWDTLFGPTDQPDDNPHAQAYTGPAYFSKATTDAGGNVSWSPAKIIINTANRQQTIGNIIVADKSNPGTLYDFTDLIVAPNTPFRGARSLEQVAFVKSTDGGGTWTQPQIIAPFNSLGVHDPNTGAPLRTGDGLEEVTIDSKGKLYVVWQSSSNYVKNVKQGVAAFDDQIMLSTSDSGGQTWSTPRVIHTATNMMPTFTPMVAANGTTVAVTFYDNGNLPAGDVTNLPTDYYAIVSTDQGANFGNPIHLAGSFDAMSAPVARGFFLGDYEGLQPSGGGFEAAFVATNCGPPYDPTTNPDCGPANYTGLTPPSSNTNPTDVFAASF
jgi:hypothetical protein